MKSGLVFFIFLSGLVFIFLLCLFILSYLFYNSKINLNTLIYLVIIIVAVSLLILLLKRKHKDDPDEILLSKQLARAFEKRDRKIRNLNFNIKKDRKNKGVVILGKDAINKERVSSERYSSGESYKENKEEGLFNMFD